MKSKAVARIAVTPAGMQSLLEVFGRNFERFVEKYGNKQDDAALGDQTIESDVSSTVEAVEQTATDDGGGGGGDDEE